MGSTLEVENLAKENKILKLKSIGHTSHNANAGQPHETSGCRIGQLRPNISTIAENLKIFTYVGIKAKAMLQVNCYLRLKFEFSWRQALLSVVPAPFAGQASPAISES